LTPFATKRTGDLHILHSTNPRTSEAGGSHSTSTTTAKLTITHCPFMAPSMKLHTPSSNTTFYRRLQWLKLRHVRHPPPGQNETKVYTPIHTAHLTHQWKPAHPATRTIIQLKYFEWQSAITVERTTSAVQMTTLGEEETTSAHTTIADH
jgi:hypothetical protein